MSMTKTVKNQETKIAALEEDKKELEAKISEVTSELEALKATDAEAKEAEATANEEIKASFEAEKSELQGKIEELTEKVATLEASISEKTEELEKAQNILARPEYAAAGSTGEAEAAELGTIEDSESVAEPGAKTEGQKLLEKYDGLQGAEKTAFWKENKKALITASREVA
jgi:chaperonin cofactor prefoldin